MNGQRAVTVIYGTLHFFVDFCCAFFLLGMLLESENLYYYFLIYNFCAFALQMPFGLLADRWKRNNLVAAAGCLMTATIPRATPATVRLPKICRSFLTFSRPSSLLCQRLFALPQ